MGSSQNKPFSRRIVWEEKRKEVERIMDHDGRKVDPAVREAVTAFLSHEFLTLASCEGHLDREEASPFPWVEFGARLPFGASARLMRLGAWEEQRRMLQLLEEFYAERPPVPFDLRLTLEEIPKGFRIKNTGGGTLAMLSSDEQEEKLKWYRREVDLFTKFLREKLLEKVEIRRV